MEIGQRRRPGIFNMTPAFHSGCGAAGDQNRQIRMIMYVRIPDTAAVKIERMVEKSSVSFTGGLQLLQELSKKGDVKLINLRHARDFFRIIAVMRKRMVGIGNTDLGVSAIARFTSELKCDDPCDVALQ